MKKIIACFVFACLWTASYSQNDGSLSDTLTASYKVSSRTVVAHGGKYTIQHDKIAAIVSPMGEADVIKYVQTLPGITMGVEGSSAMYARGGNLGNNLITLDGVPIYSSSHLLGLSTSFPQYVVGKTDFYIGGFPSEDGNLTASHIRMESKDGDFLRTRAEGSVSNFLISGAVSTPIIFDRLSLIASVRVSPIGLEYRAVKNVLSKYQNVFSDLSVSAFDVFAKAKYQFSDIRTLSLSIFSTADSYRFGMSETSDDGMGWNNTIINAQYNDIIWSNYDFKANFSFNNNVSKQYEDKLLPNSFNRLTISNRINEITLSGQASQQFSYTGKWSFGAKLRMGFLNPGTSRLLEKGNGERDSHVISFGNQISLLTTLNAQVEWSKQNKYDVRFAGRLNAFLSKMWVAPQLLANPELSVLLRGYFVPSFGVELTADYLTQYYHTLEGMPLGWSLDMVVPADKTLRPEKSMQAYAGLFSDIGKHHWGAGAYYKYMKNLIFYTDAKSLFSSSLAGWHENIELGTGTSYGAEFIYEKTGDIFAYKLCYTWSKTDRLFKNINRGLPFPAKFDRTHVGSATVNLRLMQRGNMSLRYNSVFTFQSGHWETTRNGYMPFWRIEDDNTYLSPFSVSINNYKMKDYIRWDNSLTFEIKKSRFLHTASIGVYNTLNRHNPFMLRYNETSGRWETISLIPVMPSLSYKIEF